MDRYRLLDCTLRDGGYINNWEFGKQNVKDMIHKLVEAKLDYIECGYLNNAHQGTEQAIYKSIEEISDLLPKNKGNSLFLAMADVNQLSKDDITPYTGNSIDGIRVVFYKHQIEQALDLCATINAKGYKLFVQPMVTIDYTIDEYTELARRIAELNPYAIAIVDSFGYMLKEDFRKYFKILDNILPISVNIGFHSHNNMELAFLTAQDILEYKTKRNIIIDSSLYGMGRGAGNLNTELIANYYNMTLGQKYDLQIIMKLISDYIMPIRAKKIWGYSPYLFITSLNRCHPNYASYLLDNHDVTLAQFNEFIQLVPEERKTKCTKDFVEELYMEFRANGEK